MTTVLISGFCQRVEFSNVKKERGLGTNDEPGYADNKGELAKVIKTQDPTISAY